MKRVIALLLCLSLTLAVFGAYADDAVNITMMQGVSNGSQNDNPKYISGAVALGNTVYILTSQTLEKWSPGETEPTVVIKDLVNSYYSGSVDNQDASQFAISRIFTDGTSLYGLNENSGAVWVVADASGMLATPTASTSLDFSKVLRKNADQDYEYAPQFSDILLTDGVLYVSMTDWDASGNPTYELCSWTFATGALIADQKNIALRTLTPYKDGLLLCKLYDDAKSYDEATQTTIMPQLVTYNPATAEVVKLFDFENSNLYGLRYKAANDTLYCVSGSVVYSYPGVQAQAKISAYLPNNVWEDASVQLLGDNMIVVADGNGVTVRGLDMPGIENGALTIYGEYGSNGHQAYLLANPQASVTCSDQYFSSLDEFTAAMVSGQNAVDVLRLDSDYSPLSRLIDKGYALDLSPYPELMQIAQTMDPKVTAPCMRDGKLYAMPVDLYSSLIGYNKVDLTTLGLTEDDLPTNAMQLLDFVANWQADYGEEHPDMMVTDNGGVADGILNWLMQNYIAYEVGQGETISFDTDLFHKLMEKFDSIDFSELNVEGEDQDEEFWSRTSLFSLYTSASYPGQYNSDYTFLLLPMDEGLEPVAPTTVQYMIINPRTTHLDQAVQYLSVYAQNLDPESSAITLFPDNNEPLVNKSYESDLESWKKTLADDQAALAKISPEGKAGLEEDISYFQKMIGNAESYRFTVSAEQIATYREQVAPYIVITGQTPLNVWDSTGQNEFYVLQSQYLQGAMPVDQFIKEIDKRMRMIQLEDQ